MRLRALALVLLLAPLGGCFVFDEIDNSKKMMSKQPEAKAQAGAAGTAAAAEKPPNWWEKASSLTPGEGDASIVGCRLEGRLQFMREADCLTRGGRPRRG